MAKFKFGKTSNKRMEGVNPLIVKMAHRVIAKSKVDFGIPRDGGRRTAERQNQLYNTLVNGKRVTKCDGYKKESYHQTGNALDIFVLLPKVEGGRSVARWDCPDEYVYIMELFKLEFQIMQNEGLFSCDVELICGAIDWGWDLPHLQVSPIKVKKKKKTTTKGKVENDKEGEK